MSTSNELIILCAIVFTIFGISVLGAFCFDYWIKKCEKDPRKQIEPVELKYYWKHNEDLNQANIEELTDSWEEIEMKKKLKTKKKKRSQFRRKNKWIGIINLATIPEEDETELILAFQKTPDISRRINQNKGETKQNLKRKPLQRKNYWFGINIMETIPEEFEIV